MIGTGKDQAAPARQTRVGVLALVAVVALSVLGASPAVGTQEPTSAPSTAPSTAGAAETSSPSPAGPSEPAPAPEQEEQAAPTGGTDEPSPGPDAQPDEPAPAATEPSGTASPPAEPVPTVLEASAPTSGYIRTEGTLTATLREPEGEQAPVAGAEVVVQRYDAAADQWRAVSGLLVTDDLGTVTHTYRVFAGANTFRVVFAGDETHAASTSTDVVVRGVRIASVLTLGGKQRVVDERRVRIDIRWKAADGRTITRRVKLYRKVKGTSTWRLVARPRVVDGYGKILVRPRVDTVWRAVGAQSVWYQGDGSPWHRIDNVPPIKPVVLPSAAPRPSITLPAQRRASGKLMNPVVRRIPDRVWRSMVGRSWHRGCPVGRSDLRLVRLNYWGFDGYRHRGEIVLHRTAAAGAVGAFRDMYRGRFPIRSMYRVDRFGWSSRLQGANDYRSMAADNTSGFNCRQVVGRPGVMSPHSYGRSIDLNPWENPYVSAQGTYPNTWWLYRSHDRVAWRSWSHPVVQAFGSRGFAWGGAYRDLHHFQR